MKKMLALLLSVMLLPTALFACSERDTEESESDNTESSETSAVPVIGEVSESSRPDSISIVVLGDSIARGASLESVETDRYSALLAESLKADYKTVDIVNYGVDGQTGAELLEQLKTSPADELADCDYVIISIGGNNILQFLTTLEGAEEFMAGIDPNVFADYFRYIIAETQEEKDSLKYSCETISNAFKTLNSAYASEQFDALIETASKNLETEIPRIVAELKKINPDAEILIQTIYNPYRDMVVTLTDVDETLDMDANGEAAVSKLNAPIESLADEHGYTVIHVWRAFEESIKTLTFAGLDVNKASFSLDPHPNEKGHELIAEVYYKYLTEGSNG